MKNAQFGLAVVALFAVMGCGKLSEFAKKDDPRLAAAEKLAEETSKIDILADPPSPGAGIVRRLAQLDPEAAALEKRVEDLERSALKNLIADLKKEYEPDEKKKSPANDGASIRSGRPMESSLGFAKPSAAMLMFQQSGASAEPTQIGVPPAVMNTVVMITSVLNDYLTSFIKDKAEVKGSKREDKGASYTDMSVELGRGEAGSTKFGFKINTRGKDGNRSLDSDMEGSVDGKRCPDATGKIDFTVKVKLSGSTAAASFTQEVTTKIVATTNDDADVASSTQNITQGIRESIGGRNTYIETAFDITGRKGSYSADNWRLVRTSQDLGPHAQKLVESAQEGAMGASLSALAVAEVMWQNGMCVELVAKSPGTVEPSSVTEIPVDVKHKFEGGSVPSRVSVALSGETSVSPMQIDQTPGKLSYTAPPEKNKSATIKLEARSKRGRAKLDLNATTGGNAYAISGSIDEASMSGTTCDSSQPFTIGGTLTFTFTPTSATTGTYTYRGPYSATGSGPYVINENGTMKLDGTGCIMGGGCATYSHSWTATPIDPATCKDGK